MPRLFLGIGVPESVAAELDGLAVALPGAVWQGPERFHLTLRFVGDVDGGVHRGIVDAMTRVRAPAFELALRGVGFFPPRGEPRALWAGVEDDAALRELKRRIDRALDPLGLPSDRRKFAPHVTLARLHGAPEGAVVGFLAANVLFRSPPFAVERFLLYSSVRTPKGSKYRVEAGFRLDPP